VLVRVRERFLDDPIELDAGLGWQLRRPGPSDGQRHLEPRVLEPGQQTFLDGQRQVGLESGLAAQVVQDLPKIVEHVPDRGVDVGELVDDFFVLLMLLREDSCLDQNRVQCLHHLVVQLSRQLTPDPIGLEQRAVSVWQRHDSGDLIGPQIGN